MKIIIFTLSFQFSTISLQYLRSLSIIMMKYVLIVALVVVAAQGFPQNAQLVSESNTQQESGDYQFAYKLSDDTERSESAKQIPAPAGSEDGGVEIEGSYGFKSPEGRSVKVSYTGGVAGFKPRVVLSR